MLKPTVLVAAGVIVLMGSLTACSKGNAMNSDQAVTAAVQKNLNADSALSGDAITASSQNGVVTLTGNVASESARMAAAKDAHVPGAAQVNNEIATIAPLNTQPTSAAMTANSSRRAAAPRSSSPRSPAPAPRTLNAATPVQVERGTTLEIRLSQGLSSASSSAGQSFSGTISRPVLVNGQIAIPRGSTVSGTIAAADSAGHFKGQSRLVLTLDRLSFNGQSYNLSTHDLTRVAAARGKRSVETIGGGAGLGALIGALAGHGKGAAIGAAVGAGAGTAAQEFTKPAEVNLPAETVLPFTLARPVQVVPAAAAN